MTEEYNVINVVWVTENKQNCGTAWTIANFRKTVPDDVVIHDIDDVPKNIDAFLVFGSAIPKTLPRFSLEKKRIIPAIQYATTLQVDTMGASATIYQSPLHLQLQENQLASTIIPPPVLEEEYIMEEYPERSERRAWASVANMDNGFDISIRKAETSRIFTDFYGYSMPSNDAANFAKFCGTYPHDYVAKVLRSYAKLIYNPREIQPFGRIVAEALLNGCEVEYSGNLGISSFSSVEEAVDKSKSAAKDFWDVVKENIA